MVSFLGLCAPLILSQVPEDSPLSPSGLRMAGLGEGQFLSFCPRAGAFLFGKEK